MKLELKDVSKTFGKVRALDHLTVEFAAGVYGILGANGAGKSTMINLITDNVPRDRGKEGGEIRYNGTDIHKLGKEFRRLLGYMPQQQGYYEDFTPRMFLRYVADLKGIRKEDAKKEIRELLEVVHLSEKADDPIRGFSGGMKQRVMLAQALLGDPKILILDEPTAGLDPKERIGIRNYISGLSRDRIVLYATHVVSDIECISDQILLMNQGKLVRMGSPKELIGEIRGKVAEVLCTAEEAEWYQKRYQVGMVRQTEEGMLLRMVGDDLPKNAAKSVAAIDLEDVFLYWQKRNGNCT